MEKKNCIDDFPPLQSGRPPKRRSRSGSDLSSQDSQWRGYIFRYSELGVVLAIQELPVNLSATRLAKVVNKIIWFIKSHLFHRQLTRSLMKSRNRQQAGCLNAWSGYMASIIDRTDTFRISILMINEAIDGKLLLSQIFRTIMPG